MVKPSKSMQPEHVDLQQASKRTGKGAAFGEDSFRNYMALKIATQRKQFGLVLPPPPPLPAAPSKSKSSPPPVATEPKSRARSQKDTAYNTQKPRSTKHQKEHLVGNRSAVSKHHEPELKRGDSSLNTTTNVIKSAPTIYKRSSLLERCSLAPVSQNQFHQGKETHIDYSSKNCAPSDRSVRFADEIDDESTATKRENEFERPRSKTKMESMISRLKKRHGRGNRRLDHRRLEQKRSKKRKLDQDDHQNKGDKEITNKVDTSIVSSDHEDGLAELDRLFSNVNDANSKNHSQDQQPTCSNENRSKQEIEVDAMAKKNITSPVPTEDRTSIHMAQDNQVEVDAVPESNRNANIDETPLLDHRNALRDINRDILEEQQDGLVELDRMFSTTKASEDDKSPSDLGRLVENDVDIQQQSKLIGGCKSTSTIEMEKCDESEERDRITTEDYDGLKTAISDSALDPMAETEDGDEDSFSSPINQLPHAPPSPKSIRRLRPDLFFYGVVVKIAGYTYPDNETIKRLLQKHGGDLEAYETERVTHIIAQQLSTAKANVYKKSRRPRPVCRPSWIMDSVQEGKLLPHGKYLLIEEKDQQQMGIQAMFQRGSEGIRQQPLISSPATPSPRKLSAVHQNPYAKQENSAQSPERPSRDIFEISQHSSPNKRREIPRSPKKKDKNFIDGKVRTVGTDPNFLESYFASSRLSFIGSFKQRASSASSHVGPSALSSKSKKLIFHVDMDCFFASVVLRNFPQYQDKPVVISHHGSRGGSRQAVEQGSNGYTSLGQIPKNSSSECATCNYEARKYGIKKGMYLGRAKELCPELIVLKYDFEGYEEVSQQVLDILHRFAALEKYCGVVETVSCDEAYVEMNFDETKESGEVYDEAYQMAESIRNQIFDTTRCTASIGVGANKFLAKIGTDRAKPNKSWVVKDFREVLKDLNLRDVHGVGWRTDKKLAEEGLISIQDVWDLGSKGEMELIRILGPGTGKKIYQFTQGKDDRPITPAERKTIGAECNYGVRFDGPYGIDHFMEGLAKEVEKRMEGISMKGKKLTLKIKQRKKGASNRHKFLGHGSCHNLSKSVSIPGNTATRDSTILKKVGMGLFREFAIADIHEIRGMGITISGLVNDKNIGKQTYSKGMHHWLHKSDESDEMKGRVIAKEVPSPERFFVNEDSKADTVVLSTPETEMELGRGTEVASLIEAMQSEQSTQFMIDLPPESQIQLDEIEALPQDLKLQVLSRLKRDSGDCIKDDTLKGQTDSGSVENTPNNKSDAFDDSIAVKYPNKTSTPLSGGKSVNKEVALEAESPLMIELPPMSQIRMSQVEALPNNMQQQIYSRMNRTAIDSIEEVVDLTDGVQPLDCDVAKRQGFEEGDHQQPINRFRQTDLKRMMKLAAVRSGHESSGISLTQLEQLPLEIKLQVVNRDDRQIGVLSQQDQRKADFNDRSKRKSVSNRVTLSEKASKRDGALNHNLPEARKTILDTDTVTNSTPASIRKPAPQEIKRKLQIIDKVNVWKEDLVPLKEYLNENCPVRHPNTIDMVIQFLSVVLKEGRLPAIVTMIRFICNQKNEWGKTEVVEKIVRTINDLHVKIYGASLDTSWLKGTRDTRIP